MGNAVSPNLNDTEHQLLRDNSGEHCSAVAVIAVCYVALAFWGDFPPSCDVMVIFFFCCCCRFYPSPQHLAAFTRCLALQCLRQSPQQRTQLG